MSTEDPVTPKPLSARLDSEISELVKSLATLAKSLIHRTGFPEPIIAKEAPTPFLTIVTGLRIVFPIFRTP